jgi:hypothetical protein
MHRSNIDVFALDSGHSASSNCLNLEKYASPSRDGSGFATTSVLNRQPHEAGDYLATVDEEDFNSIRLSECVARQDQIRGVSLVVRFHSMLNAVATKFSNRTTDRICLETTLNQNDKDIG